jgi:hypothetical protein
MPIDLNAAANERQRRLLEVLRRREDGYNSGVDFVRECYWPEASAYFAGGEVHGHEQFIKLEEAIFKAAPGRRIRVDRVSLAGDDVAVVEAAVFDTARPSFFRRSARSSLSAAAGSSRTALTWTPRSGPESAPPPGW